MAFEVDDEGNITLVQGDNGELSVIGLPTDKDYKVYFAIRDSKRRTIGFEVCAQSSGLDFVTFSIPAVLTDELTVRSGEEMAEYYYGIKLCDEETGLEDTLLLNDSQMGDLNTITVFPKKVEGTISGGTI